MYFLYNSHYEISAAGPITQWETVSHFDFIHYNLDNWPLQIKTNTPFGVKKSVWIQGSTSPGDDMGISINWYLEDNKVWLAYHHTGGSDRGALSDVPVAEEKTWTIFKLKRKVVLECNDVKVWELEYKDLYDKQDIGQRSITSWTRPGGC